MWMQKDPENVFIKCQINSDQSTVSVLVSKRLTKREELSFLTVLALPKASSRGLALMIWSSRVPCKGKDSPHIWSSGICYPRALTEHEIQAKHIISCIFPWQLTTAITLTCILPEVVSSFFLSPVTAIVAKYWMTRFVFTVFPAPDSPLNVQREKWSEYKAVVTTTMVKTQQKESYENYLRNQDWLVLTICEKETEDNVKHTYSA